MRELEVLALEDIVPKLRLYEGRKWWLIRVTLLVRCFGDPTTKIHGTIAVKRRCDSRDRGPEIT